MKDRIDSFATDCGWNSSVKNVLIKGLQAIGVGAAIGTAAAVATEAGIVAGLTAGAGIFIAGEATAKVTDLSAEAAVTYAISQADTEEEAQSYADLVMSMVEWGMIGLSAVGAYKGVKGKVPALRSTFSKAKVSELFGLSRAKKAAVGESVGVGKASSSVGGGSSSGFTVSESFGSSSAKKTSTNITETKTLQECSTIEFAVKMAEHQYKHNPSFGSIAGTKSHKKASDFSSKLLEKYGESMGLTKDNIQFEAQYFKRISKEEASEAGIVFPKSGYSRYDVIDLKNGIILDYKFFSYDRPSTQIFNKNRLDRMIANAPKSVNEIYGIKPVFDGNIHTGKFEAVKVWDRREK